MNQSQSRIWAAQVIHKFFSTRYRTLTKRKRLYISILRPESVSMCPNHCPVKQTSSRRSQNAKREFEKRIADIKKNRNNAVSAGTKFRWQNSHLVKTGNNGNDGNDSTRKSTTFLWVRYHIEETQKRWNCQQRTWLQLWEPERRSLIIRGHELLTRPQEARKAVPEILSEPSVIIGLKTKNVIFFSLESFNWNTKFRGWIQRMKKSMIAYLKTDVRKCSLAIALKRN